MKPSYFAWVFCLGWVAMTVVFIVLALPDKALFASAASGINGLAAAGLEWLEERHDRR